MSEQIKTRLLFLSDTHSCPPHPEVVTDYPYRWPLPEIDVAIHTGDLTSVGRESEHKKAIDLLSRLRADLKIVIPGNHDLTLDTTYYREKGHLYGPSPKYTEDKLQEIRALYTGPEAQAANIVYLEEGTRRFTLKNGASLTVYASAYTPEFCDWAFAYPRDRDRYNAPNAENPVQTYSSGADTNIDVMLTHGPPWGLLDAVIDRYGGIQHVGCEHLLRAVARARPLVHAFGHIHEGWGAVWNTWPEAENIQAISSQDLAANCSPVQVDDAKNIEDMGVHTDCTNTVRGRKTLFVNSSIMDVRYRPRQSPWIVDLMLAQREQRMIDVSSKRTEI